MITPQTIEYEFVNSTIFNNAFGIIVSSIEEPLSNDIFFIPGLINQGSLAFSFNGNLIVTLTMVNSGVSAFKTLFQTGAISGALGTTSGTTTNIYNVDLTSFVPVSGNQTVYIIAQFTQIQQLAQTILGPPSGHPDYSPNFVPTFGYTELVNSLNITATTSIPDNQTTLELARVTLTAGQTVITAVDTTHQVQARVNALFVTMAGDVTGPSNNNIISNLQGKPVTASAPITNQFLGWTGISWSPTFVSTIGAQSITRLKGQNVGGTSTTTYGVSADFMLLRNPTNNVLTPVSSFSSSCVVIGTQTGGQLNGRDQAAAFAANSFFHLYAVGGNGQTVGTLASVNGPPTGPTLLTNYNSWAYLGTFLLDGSGNLVLNYLQGSLMGFYNSVHLGSFNTSGNTGNPVSTSSCVPNIAQTTLFEVAANSPTFPAADQVTAVFGPNNLIFFGPAGSDSWQGWTRILGDNVPSQSVEMPNTQFIYYTVGTASSRSIVFIYVQGYRVPNNAS